VGGRVRRGDVGGGRGMGREREKIVGKGSCRCGKTGDGRRGWEGANGTSQDQVVGSGGRGGTLFLKLASAVVIESQRGKTGCLAQHLWGSPQVDGEVGGRIRRGSSEQTKKKKKTCMEI